MEGKTWTQLTASRKKESGLYLRKSEMKSREMRLTIEDYQTVSERFWRISLTKSSLVCLKREYLLDYWIFITLFQFAYIVTLP